VCITVHNGQPRLIMAYPGLALSPSGAARGTGACVSYGLVDNQGQRMAGQQRGDLALYRQNWVLNPFEARDTGVWQMDLGEVLVMDQTEVNGVVTDILNAAPSGASALHDPPRTMNHVESLWALLASGCSSMQIAWTAAEPGENITWQTANRVWTHHDPDAWPIRVHPARRGAVRTTTITKVTKSTKNGNREIPKGRACHSAARRAKPEGHNAGSAQAKFRPEIQVAE